MYGKFPAKGRKSATLPLYFVPTDLFCSGVILVNNILLAYLINAYLQQLDVLQTRNDEDLVNGEAVIQGERALFDASSITGTKTGASGEYYARLRAIHADVEINEREGLRRLFTRTSSTVNEN